MNNTLIDAIKNYNVKVINITNDNDTTKSTQNINDKIKKYL